MALRSLKRAFQLGSKVQLNVRQRACPMSTASHGKNQDYIMPGFDFGHKNYSAYFEEHFGYPPLRGKDRLPLFVDWSLIPGAVWEPRNQGPKGLCFKYSAAAAVRTLNFIKTGERADPSTQQLIDCNTLNGSEDGGRPEKVLNYIIESGGILTEESYPSTKKKQPCKKVKGYGITIDDWKYVKPKCEDSLKYAVNHLPVIVSMGTSGIKVNGKPVKFDEYQWGVMTGPSSYIADHSALLIGYEENYLGQLLWLLLNSHGQIWGSYGFFEVARSIGKPGGTLGILREPLVPLKWSRNKIVTSRCDSCPTCFRASQDYNM